MKPRLVLCALAAIVAALAPASAQAAPGSDATVVATTFTVAGGLSGSAMATCPVGSRVVGGGVNTAGATPVGDADPYRLITSGPVDATGLTSDTVDGDIAQHWFAYVRNQLVTPAPFKVYALCSQTSDAFVEASGALFGELDASTLLARCPDGSRVIGGGVGTTAPTPNDQFIGFVSLSGPFDETGQTVNTVDGDIARRWGVYLVNAFGAERAYKALALCSRTSDATIEAAELTLAANTAGHATARCPAGSRVLGGGVQATGDTPDDPAAVPYSLALSGPLDASGSAAGTDTGDVASRWFGYVRNGPFGTSPVFKVLALCASDTVAGGGGPGGGGPGGGGPGGGQGGGPGSGGPAPRCGGKVATIVGTNRSEMLRGTRRSDVIVALGGNDRVLAGRGNDLVCGGTGNDRLVGERGNDRLLGGNGKDALVGGIGRDQLTGGPGRDRQQQ